jgi:guanine nucleotide-binding protein G(i) subunit alpha
MKHIHSGGYANWERHLYTEAIISNTIQYMRAILDAHPKLEFTLLPENDMFRAIILSLPPHYKTGSLNEKIADAIRGLWVDPAIEEAVQPRPRDVQLKDWDAAVHYLNSIDRIAAPGYIPTDEDILYCRTDTYGVTETAFRSDKFTYKIFDVSGVRPGSESRKWIHFFEGVEAVIFVVSLSDYDEVVEEGSGVRHFFRRWLANSTNDAIEHFVGCARRFCLCLQLKMVP